MRKGESGDVEARVRALEEWVLGQLDPIARERYLVSLEEHRKDVAGECARPVYD